MNATNARSQGFTDGQRYFRLTTDATRSTRDNLLHDARNRAFYTYGARAEKTISLYVQGYEAAINAHEATKVQEQEEAARLASVPHNPNTRFCTCVACREA